MQHKSGFTLIEIVMVLVLLGILTAVAVPKYFDLQDETEKLAAQTAVAEAQARIHARFAQLLLTDNACQKALNQVKDLALLADSSEGGARFGDFVLTPTILPNEEGGTVMSAQRIGSTTTHTSVGKLLLPTCANNNEGSGSSVTDVSESAKTLLSWMLDMIALKPGQNGFLDVLKGMQEREQITSTSHRSFFDNFPMENNHAAITKNVGGTYDILVISGENVSKGIVSRIESTGSATPNSTREVTVRYEDGRYTYD